jgi:crotonobetainyl-CoA:carnitine CoA-transferase CaiB-like acyl-CoA transferase
MFFIDSTLILTRRLFPLRRIMVIDLSRLLPGGYCSLMLGDVGTKVIKVEELGE